MGSWVSVVSVGGVAPSVVSCPGLVSLTGDRSVTQGRLPSFNGITGGNDGDSDMSGLMWSICLFHNTSAPCICTT